ncbi:CBN-ATL-1 protein [Caenorhabditis brenneri]|uniref:CBN-ATL-1 protein n=1 Tax=Caenorhabditis brenneri TaxID=135651 RepID=G0NPQ7_CAEBE|nr:CBN-ATL-1 protein [Caenorhabditis brenneri]
MSINENLQELLGNARKCVSNEKSSREHVNVFLDNVDAIMTTSFAFDDQDLEEDEFIENLTHQQCILYSLVAVTEKHRLSIDQTVHLLQKSITAMCAHEDDELARRFSKIFSVLMNSASKLEENEYDTVLVYLLEVVEYCGSEASSSNSCPKLIESKTIARIENDKSEFFKVHISWNIFDSLFSGKALNFSHSTIVDSFWAQFSSYVKTRRKPEDIWMIETYLKSGLNLLRTKRERCSILEQAQCVNELFMSFFTFSECKNEVREALAEVLQEIHNFIEENQHVLEVHKELREMMLEWLNIYLNMIGNTSDDFGLLDSFTIWLVDLTVHNEFYEFPMKSRLEPVEICVDRIKEAIRSSNTDYLSNYLDILASLFKLNSNQKPENFQWLIAEVQKYDSFNEPHWPRILSALLSVQHPVCQQFCKQFAPTPESLWIKLFSKEPSHSTVNSLAIVLGSCSFLIINDERAKHIFPFLLLPCFRDFKSRVGTKWDSFRLIGGQRAEIPETLIDLERYISGLEASEASKIRAVNCALQMERKTGKYINILVDMSMAVFSKSQTDQITQCLPALVHFLAENHQYIKDYVGLLVSKLYEKHTTYADKTISEVSKTLKKLVCISSNERKLCRKCSSKGFVKPDEKKGKENLKIDESSLKLLVKGIIDNRKKYSRNTIQDFLEACRVILLHVDSKNLTPVFTPIIKAIDIGFSSSADIYFRLWELISYKSEARLEKKLLIYVPLFCRTFSKIQSNSIQKLISFVEKVLDAKLLSDAKAIVFAAFFSHSVVVDCDICWSLISNWSHQFASVVVNNLIGTTEKEVLQVLFKRYSTIFTRTFIFRFFHEATMIEGQKGSYDEKRIRETVRTFFSRIVITFNFSNISAVISSVRPSLLYWALMYGSQGSTAKYACSVVDFICQELNGGSVKPSIIPANLNDARVMLNQRKALITEMFPQLVQYSTFEITKNNNSIWKFCENHCTFKTEDMKAVTCTYRKEVFEHLILVASHEFCNEQEKSPILVQLQKTYESMKKGEKFTISTAMDTRNEGIEFIFSFRSYFTDDSHFLMKNAVAESFKTVLQNIKSQFLGTNWLAILMTLRHSPPNLDATRLSWIAFIDQLDYKILRVHIWRILTGLSNVRNNKEIIEHAWNRLNYANEYNQIAVDDMVKVYWFIPVEMEEKIDRKFIIAKSRRIEDVFEFLRNFSRYPTLQFIENLSSKIDRGTIFKEDLPRLIGALSGILPSCRSNHQRKQLIKILQKVPILHSVPTDQDFIRWDSSFKFFSEPRQLTQTVLEECTDIIENMSTISKIDYADRTMCELFKFFNYTGSSEAAKLSSEGLKNMYAVMNCSRKPEPLMLEQKTIDEMSNNGSKTESFTQWLTVIILKCAEMAEDGSLAGLASISHIDDTRFLAKLAMRFILTVIHMDRESVPDWILTTFEEALANAKKQSLTNTDRGPAAFTFYVFDFLYFYRNSDEIRRNKEIKEKVFKFWTSMLEWSTKDEYGHDQPLIVKVAEMFGMEKRCILWLEMFMELRKREQKKKGNTSQEITTDNKADTVESAFYFTLMNLYARIQEFNGVRGAYSLLNKTQIDHVHGKISIHEAYGELNAAASLASMTGQRKPFNAADILKKLIDEQNLIEYSQTERKEQEEYMKSLKTLSQWVTVENDIGPSPQVFSRSIENRAAESAILSMIRNGENDIIIDKSIEKAKSKIIDRLSECSLGGSCSYETATPYIVELQTLEEIKEFKNVDEKDLVGFDSDFWRNINRRTNDGEQTMSVLEPILRVRRSMLEIRMNTVAEKEKDSIRSRIVDAHLQSARIARLTGCLERAQLSLINAGKVLQCENKIVLEEAKLRLQTSDELNGMSLLDSIIAKNFNAIQTTYSHTQQSVNLDVQKSAKIEIEKFPVETRNLFSSVQMHRISHMIKSGNTVGFEKLFDESRQLIEIFARSGVMYEAVWFMDYLSNYNERSKPVLPLLKAYREVAKHEHNSVLQARAVERMISLWLCNTRRINDLITNTKMSDGQISDKRRDIKSMNREMQTSLDYIGWRAFYPAYAVLARHIDHKDDEVARTIKQIMKQLILRMPHQCMWQSVYLLRQNIADIKEKYMDVLTDVKRKAPCYVTIIDQYDYASGIFNLISTKVESDDCQLSEKVEGLKYLFRDKKYDPRELEMNRRLDGDCKVLSGIMVPIRSFIDESVHDPEISNTGFEESCHLPDRYLIHDFSETVKVLHSNTKPVLIELTTMTGRKVRLICKKNDDLTKDYHFNKIVEMCNDLLMKDEQTKIQNMAATTYSVIPLAKHGGIIEFIEGVTPYYDTLEKLMACKPNEWTSKLGKWKEEMSKRTKEGRAEYFRDVACKNTPVVMAKWFRLQYPEAGKWFASRKEFAKSTAVMSIIGYIFGLGDRHTKNLMVHLKTGKCVHVDFDMIFNKGETLGIPELVPFRLTQNMVNGMGEVALDGEFRTMCEQTLRVFRENSYEIEKYISDLPNLVADFANNKMAPKDFDMTEAKRLVSGRIRGQIMTVKIHKSNAITYPMQVSQLASSLIDLATSDEKLCDMFPGWMPTL